MRSPATTKTLAFSLERKEGARGCRKTPPARAKFMLLTIKDLSAWLNIKPSTLYFWAAQGKIPCQKIYGLIRFDRKQITEWLASFHPTAAGTRSGKSRINPGDLDHIIEAAIRDAYTPASGKPDQQRAQREGR